MIGLALCMRAAPTAVMSAPSGGDLPWAGQALRVIDRSSDFVASASESVAAEGFKLSVIASGRGSRGRAEFAPGQR